MAGLRPLAFLTLGLCVLALIGLVASYLALMDIYHGVELDLEAEWRVLRLTFILTGSLILSAGIMGGGVLRELNRNSGRHGE